MDFEYGRFAISASLQLWLGIPGPVFLFRMNQRPTIQMPRSIRREAQKNCQGSSGKNMPSPATMSIEATTSSPIPGGPRCLRSILLCAFSSRLISRQSAACGAEGGAAGDACAGAGETAKPHLGQFATPAGSGAPQLLQNAFSCDIHRNQPTSVL